MTPNDFRKLALSIPDVEEREHMNHPDFRVAGKIFASLGAPNEEWGMVKVTPDEQAALIAEAPKAFKPCTGAWGRAGCTNVHLASAKKSQLAPALKAAAKGILEKAKTKAGPKRAK